MILWIFPLVSCAGVLLAGYAWVRFGHDRPTLKPALIPVKKPE